MKTWETRWRRRVGNQGGGEGSGKQDGEEGSGKQDGGEGSGKQDGREGSGKQDGGEGLGNKMEEKCWENKPTFLVLSTSMSLISHFHFLFYSKYEY